VTRVVWLAAERGPQHAFVGEGSQPWALCRMVRIGESGWQTRIERPVCNICARNVHAMSRDQT